MNYHKRNTLPIISTPIQKQDVALLEPLPVAQPLLRGNQYLDLEQHRLVLLFWLHVNGRCNMNSFVSVSLGVCDASMWPCHYCRAFCWVTIPQDLLFMHSFDGHLGIFYFGANMTTAAMSNLVHVLWCPCTCVSVEHRPRSGGIVMLHVRWCCHPVL